MNLNSYTRYNTEALQSAPFKKFTSKHIVFDEYLQNFWKNYSHGEVLYVYSESSGKILAYYSIMASAIVINDDYAPAAEIVMFCTDSSMRNKIEDGQSFGETILYDAIYRIDQLSNEIGIRYIVVYSVNVDKVIAMYEKCGFKFFSPYMENRKTRFIDGCVPMYYDLEA